MTVVQTVEVVLLMSAEVVGLDMPTPTSFIGSEIRVQSSGGMVVSAVLPRSAGRKLVQMSVSIGVKCLDTSNTTRWRYCHL